MAHFDAREFLRASGAHWRRKVVAVSGLLLGAAASALLWIGLLFFGPQYLAQDRCAPEATALGGIEMAPPILKRTAESPSSIEPQGGLLDLFGAFLLRPTQDLEPTRRRGQTGFRVGAEA